MIIELLSPAIRLFLEEIEALGFSLCAIGGVTRDYFLNNQLSDDFDFEIRPASGLDITIENWPQYFKKLHRFLLEKKLTYIEMPYLITKVQYKGKIFEFSSPRKEINLPDNTTHHHFEAVLDPKLSYEDSFKRRDLTINSIGIEFDFKSSTSIEKIIDPYQGRDDLKTGILKNVSEDFYFDSVRFLRLIRFNIKFEKFVIDENLLSKLAHFNLKNLSSYHFTEELFKSRPGIYLNMFAKLVTSRNLSIPENFKIWVKYDYPTSLVTREELLAFTYLQNESDAREVSDFFKLPEKKLKDLKIFIHSYEIIAKMRKQDFESVLSFPLKEALSHELFKDLKNIDEKKEWRFLLTLKPEVKKILISWDDLDKKWLGVNELNSIDPPLRSYYPYYKIVRKIFLHD